MDPGFAPKYVPRQYVSLTIHDFLESEQGELSEIESIDAYWRKKTPFAAVLFHTIMIGALIELSSGNFVVMQSQGHSRLPKISIPARVFVAIPTVRHHFDRRPRPDGQIALNDRSGAMLVGFDPRAARAVGGNASNPEIIRELSSESWMGSVNILTLYLEMERIRILLDVHTGGKLRSFPKATGIKVRASNG